MEYHPSFSLRSWTQFCTLLKYKEGENVSFYSNNIIVTTLSEMRIHRQLIRVVASGRVCFHNHLWAHAIHEYSGWLWQISPDKCTLDKMECWFLSLSFEIILLSFFHSGSILVWILMTFVSTFSIHCCFILWPYLPRPIWAYLKTRGGEGEEGASVPSCILGLARFRVPPRVLKGLNSFQET